MIELKRRTITDKTTDVEFPIEKVQQGEITARLWRGQKVVVLPTTVEVPKAVTVTPLSASGSQVFRDGFYTNLSLVTASNSTVSKALTKSASTTFAVFKNQLLLHNHKLYIALRNASGDLFASNSQTPGNASVWKELEHFPANTKCYLVLNVNSATATFSNVNISYRVEGY